MSRPANPGAGCVTKRTVRGCLERPAALRTAGFAPGNGPAGSQGHLDPLLPDRPAADDAAAFQPNLGRLAVEPGAECLAVGTDREARARADHAHGVAGGEPLAGLEVGLAQRLARPQRAHQRAP